MALTDSLVSFWEMEEASGTRNDAHGTNHLSDHNTVTQNPGIVGNAAQFTAANTEYLDVPSNAGLVTGDVDYSIQVWAYLDSKGAFRWFVGKYGALGNREYFLIYSSSSDRFEFRVLATGTAFDVVANNFGSPTTGIWYCIHAWHDAALSQIGIAVNAGTPNTTNLGAAVHDTSTFQVEFGASPTILGTVHNGRIDQAGFWKRVLTSQDRTDLFNSNAGLSYAAMSGGGGGGGALPFRTRLDALRVA